MSTVRSFLADLAALPRDLKLLCLALFTWGMGESLFLHLVPLYLKQLGAGPVQIGNTYGIAAVAVGLVALPSGLLADRWGRRQMLLSGTVVGLIGVVLMAAASTFYWFAVGMTAYWLTSIVLPALSSYAAAARGKLSPERALTLISASFGLGNIISPALGGWLATTFGFRSIFIIGGAIYLVSTIILPFLRPQASAPAGHSNRISDLLANRSFVGFCLLVAGTWFVLYLPMTLGQNYLSEVRHLNLTQIGLLGTCNAIGLTLLNLVLGRQQPRPGLLLAQAFVGVYLILMLQASWLGWLALAYFARPAAFVSRTLYEAMATRVVRRSQWGLAFGTLETAATVATIFAPVVAGRLYAAGPARPFQVSLALLPLTVLVAYFVVPRLSHAAPEADHDEGALLPAVSPEEGALPLATNLPSPASEGETLSDGAAEA